MAALAEQLLALGERISRTDKNHHCVPGTPHAQILESVPGIGPILGAEFVVAAGDLTAYRDPGHLASVARLVPVPRDSGRRTGNMHRPKRYSRRLRRFYLSAQTAVAKDGPNRDYYIKKRSEGAKHAQALISLARRRVDVLWALIRDRRTFTTTPPTAAQAA